MVAEIFPDIPTQDEGTPIEQLVFTDSVGSMTFLPQTDITPLEAVLISQLFTRMTMHGVATGGPMAWRAYLQRTMMMRHFEPVLKGTS
jgi:hypothetical protein